MITLKTRLQNFADSVAFASDKELQHRVWIEKVSGITSIFSLEEFYCQFFDDNEIDDFILNEMPNAPITDEQKVAIKAFRDALDEFAKTPAGESGMSDASSLFCEPAWDRIVALAKKTASLF